MKLTILFSFLFINSSQLVEEDLPAVCPKIISRRGWGARMATEIDYVIFPVKNIVIHHTVTRNCYSDQTCASLLTSLQNFHMDTLHFHDIGYNFLVGANGVVYEGVGWHKVGAHTRGYNTRSLGIALIGNFTSKLPERKQLGAVKNLLTCGVELGEIDNRYKVFCARQVSATKSPGLKLYRNIERWPHFIRFPA